MSPRPPSNRVRRVHWVPRYGDPRLYLLSVAGAPAAVTATVLQPLPVPEILYGAVIWLSGLPVWHMVQRGSAARQTHPYSLWALRAQAWLQLGGAVRQALVAQANDQHAGRHVRPDDPEDVNERSPH